MLEDVNVAERVEIFLKAAHMYANTSTGPDVLMLMGNDFTYANAQVRLLAPYKELLANDAHSMRFACSTSCSCS
jgi:hypothetical protein